MMREGGLTHRQQLVNVRVVEFGNLLWMHSKHTNTTNDPFSNMLFMRRFQPPPAVQWTWSNAFKRLSVPICMEERNYSTRVLFSLFPVLSPRRILCPLCRYTMCHQAQTQETQSCDSQSSAHMNPQQGHAGPLEQVKLSCIEVTSYYPERFQRNIRLH